jgi:hypothetical protein
MSGNPFIRFWNSASLVLPATPGTELQNYTIQPTDWGWGGGNSPFMGIRFPWLESPFQANPDVGLDPESNFNITRYRYIFLGAQGLRPANSNPYVNGLQIQFGREVQNQGGLLFPFVQAGEWEEIDIKWNAIAGLSSQFLTPNIMPSQIIIDTTNLQDIYYGRTIALLFELEGRGALVEVTP